MKKHTKQHCDFLREQSKNKFSYYRSAWCEALRWNMPYRANWILSQTPGERRNQHIVDGTHKLALRSFVAGFLEGNTSASRQWFRIGTRDAERDDSFEEKQWLQHFTDRVLSYLGNSNFYDAAGIFYYDYGTVNTGGHYMEVLDNGFYVHTLIPGSYYVLNDAYGEACVLVREFSLNVKAVVDRYGRLNEDGTKDWSNISSNVKKMYEDSNYSQSVDLVQVIERNHDFDPTNPNDPNNREWLELTYETGSNNGTGTNSSGNTTPSGVEIQEEFNHKNERRFLRRFTGKRKPFIIGKSTTTSEYGENGPTYDSLGIIKSLNKKAIGKDRALEQILAPALQGPSSLRKSYLSSAPNTFVPIDARSAKAGQKLESIFQVSPAIGAVIQDVEDLRKQVDKFFFADFLLFLSQNPKTRTATETDAIVQEQQRVIGPNLQSLNRTYNVPVLEWVMDYVLFEDPFLQPPPQSLEGQSLAPEFVSIFAQAQRAADLPQIDRYMNMVANVAQIDPRILQKANLDKLADLYEDRLYLPAGLNNPQSKVDAMREQAQLQAQRDRQLQETIPAIAKAAKDGAQAQQVLQQ